MNLLVIDGIVGSVRREKDHAYVSFCHKSRWYSEKDGAWNEDDNWVTATFFGKKAATVQEKLHPGMPIVIEGELVTFPKSGPDQKLRVTGKSFHIVSRERKN